MTANIEYSMSDDDLLMAIDQAYKHVRSSFSSTPTSCWSEVMDHYLKLVKIQQNRALTVRMSDED